MRLYRQVRSISPNLLDKLSAVRTESPPASRANRALILSIILFSISLPHSIAASQFSLGLAILMWVARDFSMGRFHFTRSLIDLPLACFSILTLISSTFSFEPSVSLPKLKSLTLFGVVYLLATNLNRRGVQLTCLLLIVSAAAGVGFSLTEKLRGRGMIIVSIEADSPLSNSRLQPGDVIWMVGRQRVFTLNEANSAIRRLSAGRMIEIEALHAGDPIPVSLTVTEEMKTQTNPLGIDANGGSRQFRVSGFSRQFLTYAEQMQILGLLVYGGLLTVFAFRRSRNGKYWLAAFGLVLVIFSLGLVLTASRAVIVSFVMALIIISALIGGRYVAMVAIAAVLIIGGLGIFAVTRVRQEGMINFSDDSASRRIAYMRAGLRIIPQYPVLGIGMDSHKRRWHELGFPGDYVTHTHSTPIQVAMDRGLPALACYLWLIAAMILTAWRGYKGSRDSGNVYGQSLSIGALGALLGFSLSSLTNYNFGDSEALTMLLTVVGMTIAYGRVSTIRTA